jgi:4-hydroxybenzoate polyprenyltransferase
VPLDWQLLKMYFRNYLSYLKSIWHKAGVPYSHIGTVAIITLFFAYILGLPSLTMILLLAAFMLLAGAQDALTALTDVVADRESWSSRAMNMIGIREARILTATLFIFAVFLLSTIFFLHLSMLFLVVIAVDIFLRVTYSARPLRLKRFAMLGNLVAAFFMVVNPCLAAYVLSSKPFPTDVVSTSLLVFYLLTVATFLVEDLVTIVGDKVIGDKTVPMVIGEKPTAILASSIYGVVFLLMLRWSLGISVMPWLLGTMAAAALIVVSSILLLRSTNTRRILRICQLLSLTVGLILVSGQLFTSLF